jgi:hypothetical protein
MPDEEYSVTVADQIGSELATTGYKKRFSEDIAFKAYDRYLAQEMRLADRLRQVAIFKDPSTFLKDAQIKVQTGDIPELQALFEMKKVYNQIDERGPNQNIEDKETREDPKNFIYLIDPDKRIALKSKLLDQVAKLLQELSARQKEAMDFIEQVMARKAKDQSLSGDDIRELAKQ